MLNGMISELTRVEELYFTNKFKGMNKTLLWKLEKRLFDFQAWNNKWFDEY